MTSKLKALTIWQPWASLIIAGAKPFEFRSWPTPTWMQGKRIVIHAGSRPIRRTEVEDLQRRLFDPAFEQDRWTTGLHPDKAEGILRRAWLQSGNSRAKDQSHDLLFDGTGAAFDPLPLAAGLGTAILGAAINGFDACEIFGHRINDSDRSEHANFAWPLTEIDTWSEPITCKGAQGFWNWPQFDEAMF